MRIPDKLAVHGAGSDQHCQFLDFLGQSGFVPQVVDQVVGAPAHLRAVDHYGSRTRRDHTATAGSLRVEGGAQGLGNPITSHDGCTWHTFPPYISNLAVTPLPAMIPGSSPRV